MYIITETSGSWTLSFDSQVIVQKADEHTLLNRTNVTYIITKTSGSWTLSVDIQVTVQRADDHTLPNRTNVTYIITKTSGSLGARVARAGAIRRAIFNPYDL